jgi:hypothetical protein
VLEDFRINPSSTILTSWFGHDDGGRLPDAWIGRPQLRRGNRVRAGVERRLHRPKPELRRGMDDASPFGA